MTEYPRNMVPLKDNTLQLLTEGGAISLYFATIERPVDPEDLVRVTGLPRADAEALASRLLAAGLLRMKGERFVAGPHHVREEDFDAPGRASFRLALVSYAQGIVDEARHALRTRGDGARAGIAVITLADDPDILSRAMTIAAEAEDQMRALAEEMPPQQASRRVRVMYFTGSASEPSTH